MKRAVAILAGVGTIATVLIVREVQENRRAQRNAALILRRDAELARTRARQLDSISKAAAVPAPSGPLQCTTRPLFDINQPGVIYSYKTECR